MSDPRLQQPGPITNKKQVGQATWTFSLNHQTHILQVRRYTYWLRGSRSRVYIDNTLVPVTPQAQYQGTAFQFLWHGHNFIITVEGRGVKWVLYIDSARVE